MSSKVVKIEFKAPVHFGRTRLSDGAISCDAATLFSALYIEAKKMGIADDLLAAAERGSLLVSNAFPYVGSTYYAPKPIVSRDAMGLDESLASNEDSRARKASKKLEYLPVGELHSYFNGTLDPLKVIDGFRLGVAHLSTKVNLTREHSDYAEPYHVGAYTFYPGSGLYFLVDGDYDIEPVLEQLQYSGLGGKRSAGYGRFEYAILPDNPFDGLVAHSAKQPLYLLLSTALPTKQELTEGLLDGARYRIVRRGGFVQSVKHSITPQKKRDVYAFAAGSTFARPFQGEILDVNETQGAHSVYRYARAMWAEV